MTWLYSLIFAGLVIAADSGSTHTYQTDSSANTSQIANQQSLDVEERFEQTYPLTPDGRVRLQNINGSIEVEAWDRNEVHVLAIKVAETAEALKNIEIDIKAKSDSITIEANHRGASNRSVSGQSARSTQVRFYLKVPRNAVLDEIGTVNGAIKLSNMANAVRVSAVNGSITATDLSGSTTLQTVNGGIAVGFARLDANSKISLNTVSGRVSVTLPSNSEATVKANTLSGRIENGLGLRVNKRLVGTDMHGKIGSGAAQLRLNSISGAITINRTGGETNALPTVDLSPEKDDDDLENDLMSGLTGLPGMNELDEKAKAKLKTAMKEAQVKSGEAFKKAQESAVRGQRSAAEARKGEALTAWLARSADKETAAMARLSGANWFSGAKWFGGANWFGAAPSLHRQTGTFQIKGKPKVIITVTNAFVSVRSWNRDEVRYVVSETSGVGEKPEAEIKEDQSGDEINLTVKGDKGGGSTLPSIRVDVMVPRASDVRVISDGPIRLDGVSGNVDLTGSEESIDVRDASGKLSVKNTDGRVRVIGFSGDMNSATRDGEIFLEGDFRSLSSTAEDATVTIVLPENANARLVSTTPIFTGETSDKEDVTELSYGSGGPTYNFKFNDGRLVVRSVSVFNSF
ncbi:MAG: DUF4097 family beta strand repeat protein [Acidobacteria bacterium]|nr:DUF4097 family beta strand repeat protein [Acidobacteriota bacterium]